MDYTLLSKTPRAFPTNDAAESGSTNCEPLKYAWVRFISSIDK